MNHGPDPKFVEHLEWQIRSSLRRRERFAMPVPSGALRVARTAALILLSLMGGAGAVVAADRIQDSRERELNIAQARIEVDMAEVQLEFANKTLVRMRQLVELGVAGEGNALEAETEVVRAQADVDVLQIDLVETTLTGRPPRNELSALLVRGLDLVTQRLQIRLPELEQQVRTAKRSLERGRKLQRQVLISSRELLEGERMLADAEGALNFLRRRILIRSSFLRGEVGAEQIQLLELEAITKRRLQAAQEELGAVSAELEHVVRLEEVGAAANESPRIRLELQLLEGRIELLQLQLTALRERLGH